MAMRPPLDSALLAKEADGIRRLARAILTDAHRADDAAQETLRIALERGPRPGIPAAAWLRGVLRNVVRRTRRTDARRRAREHAAATPLRAPDSGSAERLARRKAVLEAILVLPETLRTAIELRYFEGLPPRAIARRLGVPVETCRSRVRRGLEALRAELDRREGGTGHRWALGLAPLAFPSRPSASWLGKGVLIVGTKTKVAVGLSVLALLGAGAVWMRGVRTAGEPSPAAPQALPTAGEAGTLAAAGKPSASLPDASAVPLPTGTYRVRVTGLVTDLGGEAIAGARIHAGSADRLEDLSRAPDATADSAGRFVVERTGPDVAWRVLASAPGFRSTSVGAAAGVDRDVHLRLSRTVKLWLSVRDADSDLPIEGAEVVAITADEGSRSMERTRTDAAGLASVEDPGVRAMAFEAAGIVRVTAKGKAPRVLPFDGHLPIGGTTRDRPYRLALPSAYSLTLRVVSAAGEPVTGATVLGWSGGYAGSVSGGTMRRSVEGGAIPLGSVETGADGVASVSAPGDHWYVLATKGDDAGFRTGPGTPPNPIELRLSPAISVDGVVVDDRGEHVVGAEVGVSWHSWMSSTGRWPVVPPEMRAQFRARTDGSGRFLLPRVPRPPEPRTLSLEAVAGESRFGGAQVDAPAGATTASVRIVLSRMGEPWSFLIRTSTGAPIPGALVRLPFQYPAARAGIDGFASLDLAPDPTPERSILVEAPTFATRRFPLPAARPAGPIEVVLDPEAVLDLVVRGPDGRPVPGAQVAVVADGTDEEVERAIRDRATLGRMAERHTDADGRVHVEGLPASPVRVAVELFDLRSVRNEERDRNRRVVRLPLPGPLEIVLPRAVFDPTSGSVVEGEIVGDDGRPVSGTYSAALQSAELGNFTAVSTGRRFRFEGIPAGRWQLQIYLADSNRPLLADVETRRGSDVVGLRIVRAAPARITGHIVAPGVTDLSGVPMEAVDTRGLGLVRARTTSAADGAFRFDELPAGSYRLVLRAPTAGRLPLVASDAASVDVGPGAEARVEVRAAPGARLVLVCDDPRLRVRPATPTNETLRSEEANTNVVLTWPDGRSDLAFGLHRGRNELPWALAPGRYGLRVRRFEEFVGEVVVDRTGDVEVQVTFSSAALAPR